MSSASPSMMAYARCRPGSARRPRSDPGTRRATRRGSRRPRRCRHDRSAPIRRFVTGASPTAAANVDDRVGARHPGIERRRVRRPTSARCPPAECPTTLTPGRGRGRRRWRQLGELVDRRRHVLERARPAAARLADPPVLDVPRRVAAADEIGGQRFHQVEAVRGPPEPTVDQDDDRVRAGVDGSASVANCSGLSPYVRRRVRRTGSGSSATRRHRRARREHGGHHECDGVTSGSSHTVPPYDARRVRPPPAHRRAPRRRCAAPRSGSTPCSACQVSRTTTSSTSSSTPTTSARS